MGYRRTDTFLLRIPCTHGVACENYPFARAFKNSQPRMNYVSNTKEDLLFKEASLGCLERFGFSCAFPAGGLI